MSLNKIKKLIPVTALLIVLLAAPAHADEVFFLSHPCRVLDTRLTNSRLTAGATINFQVRGIPTGQGGEEGCSVPKYATSVLLGLAAVTPAANGYARMWSWNEPNPPLAITLLMTANENNNVVTAPVTLGSSTSPVEVRLYSTTASDFVVDIQGYTTDCSMYKEILDYVPLCSSGCLTGVIAQSLTGDSTRQMKQCFDLLYGQGDVIHCGTTNTICVPAFPPG